MNEKTILGLVDHTLLSQTATFADIKKLCDQGISNSTASICIPPSFVKKAKNYVQDKIKICTVIGFPNGYSTTKAKIFETSDAILNGADEIDMVVNLTMVKDENYDEILSEIEQIKVACNGKLLKVIIETCLLTDSEKINLCHIVSKSGAEYIKTSTGFSTDGATIADVSLMKKNITDNVLVKASGGISSFDDARDLISAGASRLGTSRLISDISSY